MIHKLTCTGLSPSVITFPRCSISFISSSLQSYYPVNAETITVWAFPRSLAATGGIISLFSLPPGTKMFQFPGFASHILCDVRRSNGRVVPFGNPRVKGYLHLTAAYRSLSRPSSPP